MSISESTHTRVTVALAALLSVALVLAVFSVEYLPTNDGPQAIVGAWLHNHFGDAGAGYARHVGVHTPLTWAGFSLFFRPLERVFAWRTAVRVVLGFWSLAWAWGYLALVRAVAPNRIAIGLLGFLTAFQWMYFMGFYSCLLSMAAGLWVLALSSRGPAVWSVGKAVAVAAALYAQARMHVMGVELTGLALALIALRAGGARQVLRVACAGVPALVVTVQTAIAASALVANLDVATVRLPLYDACRMLGRAFVSGPGWRSFPVVVAAVAGAVCALVRWRRGSASRVEQGLVLAGLALMLLAVFSPLHMRAWEFFSPRFSPFAVLFCCALIPVERLAPGRRTALAAALAAYAAASIAWAAGYSKTLVEREGDVLAAMSAPLRRQGPRLTLSITTEISRRRSEVPLANPLMHATQLFALEQGGVSPTTFMVLPEIHEVSRAGADAFPPVPGPAVVRALRDQVLPPERRAMLLDFIAFAGAAYTDMVLLSDPRDGAYLVARGYEPAFHRGRALVASFRGCPARVRVEGLPAGAGAGVRASLGWPALREPFASGALSDAASGEVELRPSPCGRVWFRVEGLPAGTMCEGTLPNGVLLGDVTRDGGPLRCNVVPSAPAPAPAVLPSAATEARP